MKVSARSALQLLTRYAPRPRLAFALAVSCPLWLLPSPVSKYAGTAAIVIVLIAAAIDFLLVPTRAAISVERQFPENVGIGDEIVGTYLVSNQSRRPAVLEIYDQLPSLVQGGLERMQLQVAGRTSQHINTSIEGMTRGTAPLGLIGVRVCTRLGFVGASYSYATNDSIRVIPSLTGVRRYRLLAMQQRANVAGARVLRRKGGGQAFANLREYVQGDDPRHIDWKATSKKGKFITREYTVERSQTVITLIDAGRGMTQLSGKFSRLEHALNSALILTDIASTTGDRVGTLVFDDVIRAYVPPQASKAALQLVRDAFIPVVATSNEPDYAAAFRYLASHQSKRALIVFFTDVIDVRASQSVMAQLTRSAARHLLIIVALRNDALFAASEVHGKTSSTALFETAAAEEVIQARDEVIMRMRRAGLVVLDVSPNVMTAGVVNKYLELKSRGAL